MSAETRTARDIAADAFIELRQLRPERPIRVRPHAIRGIRLPYRRWFVGFPPWGCELLIGGEWVKVQQDQPQVLELIGSRIARQRGIG